jgi:hypothetical protein
MSTDAEKISAAAEAPKRVTIDGQTVEATSIDDKIKAAKFAQSETVRSNGGLGFRRVKIKPPGTI